MLGAQDHYRLDVETRQNIVHTLFIQSLHRWKETYRAYLVECKRVNKVWQLGSMRLCHTFFVLGTLKGSDLKGPCKMKRLRQQWRLEIQALGPHRKEHWPKPPPFPQPPSEMYNVDAKKLRSMIISALAQSPLGRSLFARDIRRVSNPNS